MESIKGQLNQEEWNRIAENFLTFVSPIFVTYLGAISALISEPNHVFSWMDLVPNSMLVGMIIKQFIDSAIDIFRKLNQGK